MSRWLTVFRFELRSLLHKKAFQITTGILIAVALLVTSIPGLMSVFSDSTGEPGEDLPWEPPATAIFVEEGSLDMEAFLQLTEPLGFQQMESPEALREAVTQGEVERGYLIHGPTHFTTVLQTTTTFMSTDGLIQNMLMIYGENQRLSEAGYDVQTVRGLLGAEEIVEEQEILGRDGAGNYFTGYILTIVAFMLVMFYGNNVATYVAREKSDRTMEILITSTESGSLIAGKVLASALVGVLQLGAILGAAYFGYRLNQSRYPEELLGFLNLNIAMDVALVYLLFTVTGYFLYLFLYAALGAMVSKVEDVPSSTALMTMLIMVAYFLALFSLNGMGGRVLTIGSFVPVTSFMVMFVRYLTVEVPLWQMGLSYGLLLGTTLFVAGASFKIYRYGTLNYGNTGNLFRSVKKALTHAEE